MTEPTYEYVKGQGWVPRHASQKWAIIFKTHYSEWMNARFKGCVYDDYDTANLEYQQMLISHRHSIEHDGWEFHIVTADNDKVRQ